MTAHANEGDTVAAARGDLDRWTASHANSAATTVGFVPQVASQEREEP